MGKLRILPLCAVTDRAEVSGKGSTAITVVDEWLECLLPCTVPCGVLGREIAVMPLRDGPLFRTRKVDLKKPLPVIFAEQLSDNAGSAITRGVQQVATGVEKEEEEEHHLREAISSHVAAYQSGAKQTYIPIPEASGRVPDDAFHRDYKPGWSLPENLIRYCLPLQDAIGIPYNLDEVDEEFLKKVPELSEDDFERIMLLAEKAMLYKPDKSDHISASQLEKDLKSEGLDHLVQHVPTVHAHWKSRRERREGDPIQPTIRVDEEEFGIDPYVSFRRRELKAPRKTRRSDGESIVRLREIQDDLNTGLRLLDLVLSREEQKAAIFSKERAIFETRYEMVKLRRNMGFRDPSMVSKRKAALVQRKKAQKKNNAVVLTASQLEAASENETEWMDLTAQHPIDLFNIIYPHRAYYRKDLQVPDTNQVLTCGRVRVGRGGRLWYDRGTAQTLKSILPQPCYAESMAALKYDDLSDEEDRHPVFDVCEDEVDDDLERRRSRIWRQMLTLRCKVLGHELSQNRDIENAMRDVSNFNTAPGSMSCLSSGSFMIPQQAPAVDAATQKQT